MNSGTHASVMGNRKNRAVVETVAQIVFTICAFFAVLAVVSITLYMIISGTPAIMKVGLGEILFGTEWMPTAADPKFGILWVILTSIVGTTLAILLGVPIGVLTAVFLAEVAPRPLAAIVKPAVELLAGIPSVIYGLLGIYLLNPLMYKLERLIFQGSTTHQFTGGANLLSAVIVLAIMILPTVINISRSFFADSSIHALRFLSLLLRLLSFDFSLCILLAQAGQYFDIPELGTYSTPHTVQFLGFNAVHRFVGVICNSPTKPMNL